MLRIGIMLDSYTTSAWVAKVIEDIESSSFARIVLVIKNASTGIRRPSLGERFLNHWKLSLYHYYEEWDYRRNKGQHDAKAQSDVSALLDGTPCLNVGPLSKGFTDRFTEEDIASIRSARLDVIFRFGFRILRGAILSASRYGVWSFHHGDNLEYRGGPPLFWEIYEKNPISGSVLQILTESLDNGRIIYRGHSSTDPTSLYRNRNPIYWKTADVAVRRLRDLDKHGFAFLEALPTYNEKNSYSRGIYRTPHTLHMLAFLARLFYRSIRARTTSRLLGANTQWFLAIRRRSSAHRFDDSSGYLAILPPKDRFYADPCLMERNGRSYIFFEDYRYAEGRACISCSEIRSDGQPGQPFEVLRRSYHLSYPFVFEHGSDVYMVPESKQNRTVELYRAIEFPHRWDLDTILLDDIHAVDPTLLLIRGTFWMFVGLSNGGYSNSDELGIFFSSRLRGPWMPHPANPVISDVRRARPGGALFYENGKLIRPSQDCGPAYGYAINFFQVLCLSETEYFEEPIGRINPTWIEKNLGTHTYTRTSSLEAIDGSVAFKIQPSMI